MTFFYQCRARLQRRQTFIFQSYHKNKFDTFRTSNEVATKRVKRVYPDVSDIIQLIFQ